MNIFYSWQSDLDPKHNREFIYRALLNAISKIENETGQVLQADRDTKGKSGAIDIASCILRKIEESHVSVFDISIINKLDKGRKCINPNVAFELGYGVCMLGWENTILIFNQQYGDIDLDLPFDLRGHRILSYNYDGNKLNSKAVSNDLSLKLKDAIETIILNPSFLNRRISSHDIKEKNDFNQILLLLSHINIPTFDGHFQLIMESNTIKYDIFYYYENLKSLLYSVDFHIYDKELLDLIQNFYSNFSNCFKFGNYFEPNGRFLILKKDCDDEIEQEFRTSSIKAKQNMKVLLTYIKEKYPHIDLRETNKAAYNAYRSFQGKFDAIFES